LARPASTAPVDCLTDDTEGANAMEGTNRLFLNTNRRFLTTNRMTG
jgi:hypothetical protein